MLHKKEEGGKAGSRGAGFLALYLLYGAPFSQHTVMVAHVGMKWLPCMGGKAAHAGMKWLPCMGGRAALGKAGKATTFHTGSFPVLSCSCYVRRTKLRACCITPSPRIALVSPQGTTSGAPPSPDDHVTCSCHLWPSAPHEGLHYLHATRTCTWRRSVH